MSLKRPPSSSDLSEAKVIKSEPIIKPEPTCVKETPESLKKTLKTLISLHSESSGDFATGCVLSDQELPNFPLIEIQGYGTLPTPMNTPVYMDMEKFFEDSPYGLGEKTMLDKSVRNSIQLDPSKFTITNTKFVTKLKTVVETRVREELGLVDAKISAKPYKLLVYKEGGKFEAHKDTEKEDNMFGTMIVQLPSQFTGGNLVVSHNGKKLIFKNSEGSSTHCKVVAHYASCLHELQEITSGYRVALVYSLCWDGNGIQPSPYVACTNSVKLCYAMNKYLDNPDVTFICWGLDFEYSDLSLTNGNTSSLKGSDKNLVQGILNAIEYDTEQSGSDQFEVYIATANHKIGEYDCGGGYERWEYGNCSFEWEINEEEHYLEDFTPILESSAKISENMNIPIDPEEDSNMMLNFDGDWEWGTDHGDGCEGPSGNEGATRDRWYKKKVLVLWKKEGALNFKCRYDLPSAIEHVYSLANDGNVEDTVKSVKVLKNYIDDFSDKDVFTVIELCCKVNALDETMSFIKELDHGIIDSDSAVIISKVISTFTWDTTKEAVLSLLKRCHIKHIQNVIYCCNLIDLDSTTTLKMLVDQLAENTKDRYEETRVSAYLHTIEFALNKNVFPAELMAKFLKNLNKLPTLYSLINYVVSKSNGDLFVMPLISHYVYMIFSKPQSELIKHVTSIVEVIKLLQHHNKVDSLKRIVDHIILTILPDNQNMLRAIVAHITPGNKENLPACLMSACLKRVVYLEGIALRGKPKMSWEQPNALVPDHPQVQEFLRGPNQRFTYQNFTGIGHARKWAYKHTRDSGCYMNITTGGTGRNAVATIVKTNVMYKKLVCTFTEEIQEYKKLIQVVPGYSDVTLIDPVEPPAHTTGHKKSSSQQVILIE